MRPWTGGQLHRRTTAGGLRYAAAARLAFQQQWRLQKLPPGARQARGRCLRPHGPPRCWAHMRPGGAVRHNQGRLPWAQPRAARDGRTHTYTSHYGNTNFCAYLLFHVIQELEDGVHLVCGQACSHIGAAWLSEVPPAAVGHPRVSTWRRTLSAPLQLLLLVAHDRWRACGPCRRTNL